MNIAYIKNPEFFKLLEVLPVSDNDVIFDPGSYGQYIGGTHNKRFSKNFINIDHYVGREILKDGFKVSFENKKPFINHSKQIFELANLHVHSKICINMYKVKYLAKNTRKINYFLYINYIRHFKKYLRLSSQPFISGDTFRSFARHKLDESSTVNSLKVKK